MRSFSFGDVYKRQVQSEEKKKGLSGKAKKYVYIGIAIAVIFLIISPVSYTHLRNSGQKPQMNTKVKMCVCGFIT